jgi:preprotein translocase SecF subunit
VVGIEIDISVLAALLTLLGYSINDTIVIFDRIRENTSIQTKVPFIDTIDTSIWQSMSRSLMTVFTTMLADVAIIIFGGETLQGFAWTLLFGLILGTYSSVFSAAPILYDWGKFFAGKFSKGVKFESPYSV